MDGYHEHTSARLYRAELHLPAAPPPDSRPARREWQAEARFEVDGFRELRTARILRDVSPPHGGPPVVDGRDFLPI